MDFHEKKIQALPLHSWTSNLWNVYSFFMYAFFGDVTVMKNKLYSSQTDLFLIRF